MGIQDLSSVFTSLLMLHFVHMDLNWKGAFYFPQSIVWVRIKKITHLFISKKFICAKTCSKWVAGLLMGNVQSTFCLAKESI